MMNKYALGTIIGSGLIGLIKSKVGSHIILKEVYEIKSHVIRWFTIQFADPSKLSEATLKIDCKGNEKIIQFIGLNQLTQEHKEDLTARNERHEFCEKNESGQCILFSINPNEVKKAAEKVLNLLIKNKNFILQKVSGLDVIDNADLQFLGSNILIKKPYESHYDENVNAISSAITKQIQNIGNFSLRLVTMDFPNIFIFNDPNTKIGQEELENEVNKIIDKTFNPYGFVASRGHVRDRYETYSNFLGPARYGQNWEKYIAVEKNGKWVPYKPTHIITQTQLRKR